KDGSTEVSDAAYRGGRHRNDFLFAEQSGVPFLDAEDFPSAVTRREHRGAYHRVESRRVTTPGGYRGSHDFRISVLGAIEFRPAWRAAPTSTPQKSLDPPPALQSGHPEPDSSSARRR